MMMVRLLRRRSVSRVTASSAWALLPATRVQAAVQRQAAAAAPPHKPELEARVLRRADAASAAVDPEAEDPEPLEVQLRAAEQPAARAPRAAAAARQAVVAAAARQAVVAQPVAAAVFQVAVGSRAAVECPAAVPQAARERVAVGAAESCSEVIGDPPLSSLRSVRSPTRASSSRAQSRSLCRSSRPCPRTPT